MTLRTQIEPLLEEFKKSNGKGNVNVANLTLVKIIDALVSHIETMTTSTPFLAAGFNPAFHAAAQAPVYNGRPELNSLSGHAGWAPPAAAAAPASGDIVGKAVVAPENSINYSLERKAAEEALATGIDVEQEIVSALTVEGKREVLLDAARALHEGNYLPGPEHDAIVDHILNPAPIMPEKAQASLEEEVIGKLMEKSEGELPGMLGEIVTKTDMQDGYKAIAETDETVPPSPELDSAPEQPAAEKKKRSRKE